MPQPHHPSASVITGVELGTGPGGDGVIVRAGWAQDASSQLARESSRLSLAPTWTQPAKHSRWLARRSSEVLAPLALCSSCERFCPVSRLCR